MNDEVADKNFELELSWVGQGNSIFYSFGPVGRPNQWVVIARKQAPSNTKLFSLQRKTLIRTNELPLTIVIQRNFM